jgi:regulator of replication initiation timing
MVTPIEALSTFKTAFDIVKGLREYLQKKKPDPEVLDRIAALQSQLLDAQSQLSELIEEISKLRQANEALRTEMKNLKELEFRQGLYWRKGEGIEDKGPFCPTCFDKDRKLIHLLPWGAEAKGFRCHVCNFTLGKPARISIERA